METLRKGKWPSQWPGSQENPSQMCCCYCFYRKQKESEIIQSCPTLCDPVDCAYQAPLCDPVDCAYQAPLCDPVDCAYQAPLSTDSPCKNTGVGVTISFSRGFSQRRDRTQVSRIGGRRFNL